MFNPNIIDCIIDWNNHGRTHKKVKQKNNELLLFIYLLITIIFYYHILSDTKLNLTKIVYLNAIPNVSPYRPGMSNTRPVVYFFFFFVTLG